MYLQNGNLKNRIKYALSSTFTSNIVVSFVLTTGWANNSLLSENLMIEVKL